MTEGTGTGLVPAPEGAAVAPTAPTRPLTMTERMSVENLMMQIWTSLPDTPEGRLELARHLGGADAAKLSKEINTTLKVAHVLVHRVNVITEDGEEIEADRCVLIGPDGEAFACVSEGVRKSIQILGAVVGIPPWSPPLELRVVQTETRSGRRFFQLLPVATPATGKTEKAKK